MNRLDLYALTWFSIGVAVTMSVVWFVVCVM